MKIDSINTAGSNYQLNIKNNNPMFGMTTTYAEKIVSPKKEEKLLAAVFNLLQKLDTCDVKTDRVRRFFTEKQPEQADFIDIFNFGNDRFCMDVNMPDRIGKFRVKTKGGMSEKSKEMWATITDALSKKEALSSYVVKR